MFPIGPRCFCVCQAMGQKAQGLLSVSLGLRRPASSSRTLACRMVGWQTTIDHCNAPLFGPGLQSHRPRMLATLSVALATDAVPAPLCRGRCALRGNSVCVHGTPSSVLQPGRRSFCGSADDGSSDREKTGSEGPELSWQEKVRGPKRKPVDTRTVLDEHRASRRVERRIEAHKEELRNESAAAPEGSATSAREVRVAEPAPCESSLSLEDVLASAVGPPSDRSDNAVMAAPKALRINDPNAPLPEDLEEKDLVIRSRTTTGQVLWPATKEDIEILSESKHIYPAPYEVEGSVIIRLVRLSDPVTSPVGRVVRNRQFGIRGNEKYQLLAMGVVCAAAIYMLGFWQLQRMEWKRALIEKRRTRLAMPRLSVTSSPFPWKDKVDDHDYRIIDARGVFDHRKEMHIGPRPGFGDTGDALPGYLVVTPLRFEDGSTVLVNRGHCPIDKIDQAERPESPTWVRVRGVLEQGEIPNMVAEYARLKNRPDKGMFVYLIAPDLAECAGARNHEECRQAIITAIDVLHEDDFKAGVRRPLPFTMRHKEDYLLFWADEHTHFNYAMQWFAMGTLIMTMTVYKFIEVSRWKF